MPYLTQQVAAWKTAWERLASRDEHARRRFLEHVGAVLGERDPESALCRGRIVLGLNSERPHSERR